MSYSTKLGLVVNMYMCIEGKKHHVSTLVQCIGLQAACIDNVIRQICTLASHVIPALFIFPRRTISLLQDASVY